MKVKECELVFRYHVYFNWEESCFLRARGWLHPMSKPETDIWWTEAEIENLIVEFPELEDKLKKAIDDAKGLADEARKKLP